MNKKAVKLFVDLDCVLANFNAGFAEVFGLEYPEVGILGYHWFELGRPDLGHFQRQSIIEEASHLYADLPPYSYLPELVTFFNIHFPEWCILTGTVSDPRCWSGKVEWVSRHIPGGVDRLILVGNGKSKALLSGEDRILVDDRMQNCEEWREAGGRAFLWRDYSVGHPAVGEQIAELKQRLLDACYEE